MQHKDPCVGERHLFRQPFLQLIHNLQLPILEVYQQPEYLFIAICFQLPVSKNASVTCFIGEVYDNNVITCKALLNIFISADINGFRDMYGPESYFIQGINKDKFISQIKFSFLTLHT